MVDRQTFDATPALAQHIRQGQQVGWTDLQQPGTRTVRAGAKLPTDGQAIDGLSAKLGELVSGDKAGRCDGGGPLARHGRGGGTQQQMLAGGCVGVTGMHNMQCDSLRPTRLDIGFRQHGVGQQTAHEIIGLRIVGHPAQQGQSAQILAPVHAQQAVQTAGDRP